MKALIVIGLCGVCLLGSFAASEEPKPEAEQKTSYWMKKKLDYSKEILAGLTQKDFESIRKNAGSMNALNQLEKWFRANTPEYRQQLQSFRSANEQLIAQAKDENLDGAAIAYLQLTLSCVHCHRLIRDPERPR